MNVSDLIGIGRIGGQNEEGYYHVMVKPEFRSDFDKARDVFLIFNSDRVFYVTISDKKVSERKLWVRFAEDGIAEERKLHKEVLVAIEQPDADDEDIDDIIGYEVYHLGVLVGTLSDYFHNKAQYVIVVQTPQGAEFMIPYVDRFVSHRDDAKKRIQLIDADELLREQ